MLSPANARRIAATVLLGALAVPASPHTPPLGVAAADSIERAIRDALPFLQEDGEAWLEGRLPLQDGQGCVSCHQVPFGVWALEEAGRAGIVFDSERRSDLAGRAAEFVASPGKARAMSWGPLVLAAGEAPGGEHAGFAVFARQAQRSDGTWAARGQFPEQRRPLAETNAVATMWTLLALAPYGEAAPEQPLADAYRSIGAAAFEGARSTEHLLLRSWVEDRFGEADDARELLERLLELQNADGGWSWLPGEESNALSTGQVLYRLGFVPPPPTSEQVRAIERGARYLIETQAPDGRWAVASALTSQGARPSKDYVYTYWGTAWAAIGLARTLVFQAPATEPEALRRLRERATISLVGAPFEVVVSYFSRRLGAELELDPELAGKKVTVELDDQSAEVGLDALCDQVRCVWDLDLTRRPARLRFARRGPL